jgi:hypothetical protein
MVLEIILSFQVVSVLFLPFFHFQSILPKLWASSERIGEKNHYIVATANNISAA